MGSLLCGYAEHVSRKGGFDGPLIFSSLTLAKDEARMVEYCSRRLKNTAIDYIALVVYSSLQGVYWWCNRW